MYCSTDGDEREEKVEIYGFMVTGLDYSMVANQFLN